MAVLCTVTTPSFDKATVETLRQFVGNSGSGSSSGGSGSSSSVGAEAKGTPATKGTLTPSTSKGALHTPATASVKATPTKMAASIGSTPGPTSTAFSQLPLPLPSINLSDLVSVTRDLLLFRTWTLGSLPIKSIDAILGGEKKRVREDAKNRERKGSTEAIISRCFSSVANRLETVQSAVWDRAGLLLTGDCKKSLLSAVKAIAGR